jgi:hypothetical protein
VGVVTAPATSSVASAPIDHLAPGELLEGTDKAFGMILPRGVRVVHGFDDLVIASGSPPADKVTNYVRARVRDGKITVGARATVFDHVRTAAAPDLELSIRVEPADGMEGTRIEVRKLTMPKAPDLPNDEERWRAAGLRPDGRPIDPKKMQ